jgi:beta-aspartyl-dipeptidase (metallo-type)
MITLLKNADLYAPTPMGMRDILIVEGRIQTIDKKIDINGAQVQVIDAGGKKVCPGLIDQHIHIAGAGGKDGFLSMTPEIKASELIACGTTTAVGLLGTDGTARNIRALFGKVQSLRQEGVSAFMYSGYYGSDTLTITESITSDMIFIEPVLGFKIAISDVRSSYPTALELVRKLREVRVGGMLGNKKGIMHVHLGNLKTQMDVLFEIVEHYEFPIAHISPTHVGRSLSLFDQAIAFGKLGGMIDITTAASKYTDPYKSVIYALDQGLAIEQMTFSTDGHAGLSKTDNEGKATGFRAADINENLNEIRKLIQLGGLPLGEALKLVTTGPAKNLGLAHKGQLLPGADADLCWFDDDLQLTDVWCKGQPKMSHGSLTFTDPF